MEAHGCHISKVEPHQVPDILDKTNFCFLFSQTYHPAMKQVAALRKEIGVPTVFNLLGPMSNPAKPSRVVVGVHSPQVGALMANALKLTGIKELLVVCGAEKLDEVWSHCVSTYGWLGHHCAETNLSRFSIFIDQPCWRNTCKCLFGDWKRITKRMVSSQVVCSTGEYMTAVMLLQAFFILLMISVFKHIPYLR